MSAAFLLAVLLQASNPWAAPVAGAPPAATPQAQAQPDTQPDQVPILFIFYRARYFHDAAALRECARAEPERTRALDARYEALKALVARQFGADRVVSDNDERPERGADPNCRTGVTLTGYEDALSELGQRLGASGQ